MNSSSPSAKELSPSAKESSPSAKESSTREFSPKKANIKLKRSSPVLTTRLSSPLPNVIRMESLERTSSSDVTKNEQENSKLSTTSNEVTYAPITDLCSSDDELLSGEKMKLNRKRSTLSKRLSTSADNVLDIQDDKASQSTTLLSSDKKIASRSRSTDNLSVSHTRGSSTRRSFRKKNQISTGSPKSPPHDGNKLISLAQGILTNLRIPGFSRQPSGSEPPLRSSWCLKMYDGNNELESNTGAGGAEQTTTKVEHQTAAAEETGKKRYRNSKMIVVFSCCQVTFYCTCRIIGDNRRNSTLVQSIKHHSPCSLCSVQEAI